jgi:hypothetical protein
MTNYDPNISDGFVRLSRLMRAGRLSNFVWGLLSQTHNNEDARPRTQGPEPSATRLAPRAFSFRVVDSLGESFVWGRKSTHAPISS